MINTLVNPADRIHNYSVPASWFLQFGGWLGAADDLIFGFDQLTAVCNSLTAPCRLKDKLSTAIFSTANFNF
jgi:hypothetical protein